MNQLDNQFAEADLSRRTSELDNREKTIADKERLLQGVVTDKLVEVGHIEKRIAAKKTQLNAMDGELAAKEADIDKQLQHLDEQLAQQKAAVAQQEALREQKAAELEDVRFKLKDALKQLKDVNGEISERRKYLADQEVAISEAIADGSQRIRDIVFDADKEEASKVKLLQETHKLRQEIEGVRNVQDADIAAREKQFATIGEDVEQLKKEYAALQNQVEEAKNELARIQDETGETMRQLEIKQKELNAKANAIKSQSVNLDKRERRLDSIESLI